MAISLITQILIVIMTGSHLYLYTLPSLNAILNAIGTTITCSPFLGKEMGVSGTNLILLETCIYNAVTKP